MFRFIKAFGMLSVISVAFFSDEAYSRGSPPPPPPPPPADNSPAGSYKQSCNNRRVNGDNSITATCAYDGGRRNTRLPNVNQCKGDISNKNGNLYCDRGLPAGSYLESCDNMDFNGSKIDASCRGAGTSWQFTSLRVGKCKTGTISNKNGQLICNLSETITQPLESIKISVGAIDNMTVQAKNASGTQETKSDILQTQLDAVKQIKTNLNEENKKIQDNMAVLNNNTKNFTNDADVKPLLDQATGLANTSNIRLASLTTYTNTLNKKLETAKNIETNLDKSQKELDQINAAEAKIKANLEEAGKVAQAPDNTNMQQKLTNITALQQSSVHEAENVNTSFNAIQKLLKDYANDGRVSAFLAKVNKIIGLVKKQNEDLQNIKSSISQQLSALLDKEKKQKEIMDMENVLNQNLILSAQHVQMAEQKSVNIDNNIKALNFGNAEKMVRRLEALNTNALPENSKLHIKHAVELAGTDADLQKLIALNEKILADTLKNADRVKAIIAKIHEDIEAGKKYQKILKDVQVSCAKTQQAFQNMQASAEQIKSTNFSTQDVPTLQNILTDTKGKILAFNGFSSKLEESAQITIATSQNRQAQAIQVLIDQTKSWLEVAKQTKKEVNNVQDNVEKALKDAEVLQSTLDKATKQLEKMRNNLKESQALLAQANTKADTNGKTPDQLDARIKEVTQNLNDTTKQEDLFKGAFDTLNKNLEPFKANPKVTPVLAEAQKGSSDLSNMKQQINAILTNLTTTYGKLLQGEAKKAKIIEGLNVLDKQITFATDMQKKADVYLAKIQEQISQKNFDAAESVLKDLASLNPQALSLEADAVIAQCTSAAGSAADILSLIEGKKPLAENIKKISASVQANIEKTQNNFQITKKKESDLKDLQSNIVKKMQTLRDDAQKTLQKVQEGESLGREDGQTALNEAQDIFKDLNTLYQSILALIKDNPDSTLQKQKKDAEAIFDEVQKAVPDAVKAKDDSENLDDEIGVN